MKLGLWRKSKDISEQGAKKNIRTHETASKRNKRA